MIEIKGVDSVKKMLNGVKARLDAENKKAFREIGQMIVTESKQRVPVDSGDLQKSIKYKATKTRVRVFARKPYAAAIHWGRKRNGKGGGRSKSVPFIYDAVVANKDKIRTILAAAAARATK